MSEVRWKSHPTLAGVPIHTATVQLRERPGPSYPPVGTRAELAVLPDLERSVRWMVVFRKYVPQRPLQARVKVNETTRQEIEVPPPPIIPERRVGDRISYEPGGIEAAIQEAKKRCEETARAGRPQQ